MVHFNAQHLYSRKPRQRNVPGREEVSTLCILLVLLSQKAWRTVLGTLVQGFALLFGGTKVNGPL
jgi:hypothetical protein